MILTIITIFGPYNIIGSKKISLFGSKDCGQLGNGEVEIGVQEWPFTPQVFASLNIAKVKCGLDHTLALTVDGQVYSWGMGGYAQLGQPYSDNDIEPNPQLIEGIPPLIDIFSGTDHSGGIDSMININYKI